MGKKIMKMPNKLNNDIFIKKSIKIHNNFYDYSKINYYNYNIKVEIGCPIHGYFFQSPNCHLKGQGKYTNEEFINKAKFIYGDKYDFDLVNYKGNKNKVKLICKNHGIFEQRPDMLLQGHGCLKCSGREISNTIDFIKKSNLIHDNLYDYSKSNYVNAHTKLIIRCEKHGDFLQKPNSHLSGCGCPICKLSKGEMKIKNFLDKYEIKNYSQHEFKNFGMPFDFYIPSKNYCIEYDGIQHYTPIKLWGGENGHKNQLIRDQLKNKFCDDNNIKLLRISYTDFDKIDNILKMTFFI